MKSEMKIRKKKQKQNNTDLPHNGYKRTVSKNLENTEHTYIQTLV